jgi:hypothetical protein
MTAMNVGELIEGPARQGTAAASFRTRTAGWGGAARRAPARRRRAAASR